MITTLAAFCIMQQISFQEINCKLRERRFEKAPKQKNDAPCGYREYNLRGYT